MIEEVELIPIPRVPLSPHDLRMSRDQLISKHHARVADLVRRYPELGEDLAARQALEEEGLGLAAVPRRFAREVAEIGYILALKERVAELRIEVDEG